MSNRSNDARMRPADLSDTGQGSLFGRAQYRGGADPAVAQLLESFGCPYHPGAKIGEGSMARVYFGTHRRSGRPAAIKVPKGGPWAVDRFRREVDVMDKLDHPHVMPLLEADPERRWYAMPWAEYSLADMHRRDPLDWPGLHRALCSVTGGMMHAHANDCIHRDASPANVLRLQNSHWALSDFGIAKIFGRAPMATRSNEHFGTPDFSAPEVYADPSNATSAADAWSIGALASWYTGLLPGKPPKSSQDEIWLELIEHTMRRNPSERWSIPEITSYLNAIEVDRPLLEGRSILLDVCPRCGQSAGRDSAERCRRCGFLAEA